MAIVTLILIHALCRIGNLIYMCVAYSCGFHRVFRQIVKKKGLSIIIANFLLMKTEKKYFMLL